VRKGTHKRACCSTRHLIKRVSIRKTRKDYTQAGIPATVTAKRKTSGGANV